MDRPIDEFDVADRDGKQHTVLVFAKTVKFEYPAFANGKEILANHLTLANVYVTSDGDVLKMIDDETFEVVATGERWRKLAE